MIYLFATFFLAVLIAEPIINLLVKLKSEQSFRDLGPKSHIETKQGTPTMGAWIFLIPIFIALAYLYFQSKDLRVLFILFSFIVGTSMGALDDGLKVLKSNYAGLDSKNKLFIQLITSSLVVFFSKPEFLSYIPTVNIEFSSLAHYLIEYIWAFCVIAGASNAINLTDGLDGLATGISVISFLALGLFLFIVFGDSNSYIISLSISGALLGFLIFNKKPARVFMGDTGSLALGMGLGTMAYINHVEWYLLIFAFIPVLEVLSVIAQVLSAKLSRKFFNKDWRLFKMAPLHHHFELSGLDESRVVQLFWTMQFIVAMVFLVFFVKITF